MSYHIDSCNNSFLMLLYLHMFLRMSFGNPDSNVLRGTWEHLMSVMLRGVFTIVPILSMVINNSCRMCFLIFLVCGRLLIKN